MYNNCARVTILDIAVVKIVCCTQEGLLHARSKLHPDDTAKIGHLLDTLVRKRSRGLLPLRATVWTRRPLEDKPPIDHRLAVVARVRGSVPHTSALVCFFRTAPQASTDACLLDLQFKMWFPWFPQEGHIALSQRAAGLKHLLAFASLLLATPPYTHGDMQTCVSDPLAECLSY